MSQQNDQINQLLQRLEVLLKQQDAFANEIYAIKRELLQLQRKETDATSLSEEIPKPTIQVTEEIVAPKEVIATDPAKNISQQPSQPILTARKPKPAKVKGDWEKFIGENLISKIGILITVIGVAIGAKYSIENDLISPLTRIILGYLAGIVLLGFGIKLKKKYENYSAVLVSGAIAILYFITFAAYDFYSLIPQLLAFFLMVVFTVFGVVAALNYNRQVIAIIGLLGAYAVPYLLSDGSGQVAVMFSYIAIINVGILVISFKKQWKPLYYTAFALTWIIYLSWYLFSYSKEENFLIAFLFVTVFFLIFYITFLAYKLIRAEKLGAGSVIVLLLNAFIFYGIGYALLNNHETGKELLGIFTVFNAIIHFIAGFIIHRKKLANNLFYLIAALVLTFVTIAFPVQLDGNWVTLFWTAEAALLFWLGRSRNIKVYEALSYPLMILAFFSLVHDWENAYGNLISYGSKEVRPLLNIHFLTSLLFTVGLGFVNYLYFRKASDDTDTRNLIYKLVDFMLPALLITGLYLGFRFEIANYWNQLIEASYLQITPEGYTYPIDNYNDDLYKFKTIWILNYSLLFVSFLSFFNLWKTKNKIFGFISILLTSLTLLIFLVQGLYVLGELRESYLNQSLAKYYETGFWNIGIRYIALVFAAISLYALYRQFTASFMKWKSTVVFGIILHIALLWIASSELIHWMDMGRSEQSYKLGLSILWGVYALGLIAFGIWKKKKYLRIIAIVLFGGTLIKLFFYDIAHLNTISKTIVFVSLGVLLLIISFLYNKFKHSIADEK
ncbi:DUF2339 domain-containing protein [Flavobacteriaceae bacterium M23B6Z8]